MIEMKSDLIDQYIKINNDIIVVFGSETCKYCLILKPQLQQLSEEFPDKEIIFIDGDKFSNSADQYEVEEYPTIIHFKNQIPVSYFVSNKLSKIRKLWK